MSALTEKDSRFVAAYTSNNQVVLLNALISEFVMIDNPLGTDDSIQGVVCLDTHLIIYGKFSWSLFTIAGKEVETKRVLSESPILQMIMILFEHVQYSKNNLIC